MLLHHKEEERESDESESLFFEEAVSILKKLPKKEEDIKYIELQGLQIAENESYLYSCGIADGIRMMKYIEKL